MLQDFPRLTIMIKVFAQDEKNKAKTFDEALPPQDVHGEQDGEFNVKGATINVVLLMVITLGISNKKNFC